MFCSTSPSTGRRTRSGEAAWASSSPSRALTRTSVPTKRRRPASESGNVCWPELLIKNQLPAVCEVSCARPRESPYATQHILSTFNFFPSSCFFPPQRLTRVGLAVEQLLWRAAQALRSVCCPRAPQQTRQKCRPKQFPSAYVFFFFDGRLHLNCKPTSSATGRSIVNGRQWGRWWVRSFAAVRNCATSSPLQKLHSGDALWTSRGKLFITGAN